MEATCEYCGSEINGETILHSDSSFCSHDCVEAATGEVVDNDDEGEFGY